MRADITRWTCAKCDAKVDKPLNITPAYWMGVTLYENPTTPDGCRRLHVCEECAKKVREALGVEGTSWWLR